MLLLERYLTTGLYRELMLFINNYILIIFDQRLKNVMSDYFLIHLSSNSVITHVLF